MVGQDLVNSVALEMGVIAATETPTATDSTFILGRINRVLDNWNAEWGTVYASDVNTFTLTPGLQPHTIGPSTATWTATQRPVSIEAANVIVNTMRYPIRIRDDAWWQGLTNPTLSTLYPYDLNYRETWPNGSIYFWPVPSGAYVIELYTRLVLAALTLAGSFTLPPGYEAAIVLTTAEQTAQTFGRPLNAQLVKDASAARARVAKANTTYPRIATRDDGLGPGNPGWFDYLSRSTR